MYVCMYVCMQYICICMYIKVFHSPLFLDLKIMKKYRSYGCSQFVMIFKTSIQGEAIFPTSDFNLVKIKNHLLDMYNGNPVNGVFKSKKRGE